MFEIGKVYVSVDYPTIYFTCIGTCELWGWFRSSRGLESHAYYKHKWREVKPKISKRVWLVLNPRTGFIKAYECKQQVEGREFEYYQTGPIEVEFEQ